MRFPLIALASVGATALVLGAVPAAPALAAATGPGAEEPYRVIESMSANGPIGGANATADDGYLWSGSTLTTGLFVDQLGGDTPADGIQFDLMPAAGQALHVGHYTDPGEYGIQLSIGDRSLTPIGDVDVLDLRTSSTGHITAFDVVFRTDPQFDGRFGEVRMNESESTVADLSAHHLEFPDEPVGVAGIPAVEGLTNRTTVAQRVGTVAVSGGGFRLADDACSGVLLAAGATCRFDLAFDPAAPGPATGAATVSLGGVAQRVDLAGSALLGTSRLTTSGADWVDGGVPATTNVFGGGVHGGWLETSAPGGGEFVFGPDSPTDAVLTRSASASFIGTGAVPAIGTHALVAAGTPGYEIHVSELSNGLDRGCSTQIGSETVHAFALDANGLPSLADITFSVVCDGDTAHPMTGTLLYQERADTVAPAAPTKIAVGSGATRTVTWTRSASSDAAATIVRLFPSTGTGGTVTSGLAVASGGATLTTATLPALVAGARYTVAVFAVDSSGNTSLAGTAAVTG